MDDFLELLRTTVSWLAVLGELGRGGSSKSGSVSKSSPMRIADDLRTLIIKFDVVTVVVHQTNLPMKRVSAI